MITSSKTFHPITSVTMNIPFPFSFSFSFTPNQHPASNIQHPTSNIIRSNTSIVIHLIVNKLMLCHISSSTRLNTTGLRYSLGVLTSPAQFIEFWKGTSSSALLCFALPLLHQFLSCNPSSPLSPLPSLSRLLCSLASLLVNLSSSLGIKGGSDLILLISPPCGTVGRYGKAKAKGKAKTQKRKGK